MPCFLAAALEYSGETFAALYPVNAPVSLAMMEGDRLVPVEDETDAMISAAKAACAEKDIELLSTPVVLTCKGPGLEIDTETEALEISGDDDDEDETEEALVLAELTHDGTALLVVQPLDPLYVVGKARSEKQFVVPSDKEIEAVSDTIEELVVEFEEGFDLDDDDELDFGV